MDSELKGSQSILTPDDVIVTGLLAPGLNSICSFKFVSYFLRVSIDIAVLVPVSNAVDDGPQKKMY